MKILLTGANGQLGRHLRPRLQALGRVVTTARGAGQGIDHVADLGDSAGLDGLLQTVRPDIIVNAAAWTAVDAAEREEAKATRLNRDVPRQLARWARAHDALLLHYSTDYVFDGAEQRPWKEDDAASPLNVYGATKRAGELLVLDSGCRALVLRTSWVYSRLPGNFLSAILARAARGEALRVVNDQTGSPTWAGALAQASTVALVQVQDTPALCGLYHVSCRGAMSWYAFACLALDAAVARGLIDARPGITPIASDDWPQHASRPAWSVLDTSRFSAAFDHPLPSVETAMHQCFEEDEPPC